MKFSTKPESKPKFAVGDIVKRKQPTVLGEIEWEIFDIDGVYYVESIGRRHSNINHYAKYNILEMDINYKLHPLYLKRKLFRDEVTKIINSASEGNELEKIRGQ